MKKKVRVKPVRLDKEEKELLESFEKNEWKSVKKLEEEIKATGNTAFRTLCKNVRINIRLSSSDVANIKQIAAYEGLPYQTLIASVLHKFAAGHLQAI